MRITKFRPTPFYFDCIICIPICTTSNRKLLLIVDLATNPLYLTETVCKLRPVVKKRLTKLRRTVLWVGGGGAVEGGFTKLSKKKKKKERVDDYFFYHLIEATRIKREKKNIYQ